MKRRSLRAIGLSLVGSLMMTGGASAYAPDTFIVSGPSGTINTDSAYFTYYGIPGSSTSGFECRLDDDPFIECNGPGGYQFDGSHTFENIVDGTHTAAIRGYDYIGNPDPDPATRVFTVDTTPPEATPPSLIFATQAQGTNSAPQTVTVTNTSGDLTGSTGEDITVNRILATGDGRTEFLTVGENCLGEVIPVLGTCEVPIRFSPYESGTRNATLEIRYSVETGPTPPLTVALSGIGGDPPLGATGAVGATGATGSIGPTGSTGNNGATGPIGPTGSAGATGVTGETGPQGPIGVAGFSKVEVSGPAKVKRKRKASYTVMITNSGNAAATGVKLQITGKGIKANRLVGKISGGATKKVKVKVKPKKTGKISVSFKVRSDNAGGKAVKKEIVV